MKCALALLLGLWPVVAAAQVDAYDPGNGDGYDKVRWAAIVLERAHIQWQRIAKLGIRVGQFLTPYGMVPDRHVGIEVFGRFDDLLWDR